MDSNYVPYAAEVHAILDFLPRAIELSLNIRTNLQSGQIERKDDGTIVSICDMACQAIIMDGLRKFFPDDKVLGEENPNMMEASFLDHVRKIIPSDIDPVVAYSNSVVTIDDSYHRCWVVDPIDGTKGFVSNKEYAMGMALLIDRHLVFSATAWPRHETWKTGIEMEGPLIFMAAENHGAYCFDLKGNMKKIEKQKVPSDVFICTTKARHANASKFIYKNLKLGKTFSAYSMIKGLMIGVNAATAYPRFPWGDCEEHAWDVAPFELFIREAGGFATSYTGEPLRYRANGNVEGSIKGIICTNRDKEYHERVLKLFNEAISNT